MLFDGGIFVSGNAGLSGCINSLDLLGVLKGPNPGFDSAFNAVPQEPYLGFGRFNGTGLSTSNCPVLAAEQRTVLLSSKSSLGGNGVTVLTGWNATSFPCVGGAPAWPGIASCEGDLVRSIDLSNTGLTSTTLIAAQWSSLVDLASISLPENPGLTGPLPSDWSRLTNLVGLNTRDCGITGNLPNGWGQGMRNMMFLDLAGNSLGGTIPTEWSTMRKMAFFQVFDNQLSGTLPGSFSTMEKLLFFLGDQNQFNGPLPSAWSTMRNLTTLGLSRNSFAGTLPATWSTLTELAVLALHDNSLAGTIPAAWSSIFPASNFPRVFLYNNPQLGGCFPTQRMLSGAKGSPGFDPRVPIRLASAYNSAGRVANTALLEQVCT
jgi:hypothetical protein